MKIAFDFQKKGPVNSALHMILSENEVSVEESNLIVTESVDKVLHYLQNTDKKVVQFAYEPNHPMTHLIEDYPNRLRVVDAKSVTNTLQELLASMQELMQ